LIISGDGYFAFSEDAFFEPSVLKSVDLNTLSDLKDIDYVLTTLPQAKKSGDWLVAETSFDPKDIKIEGDKLYFSLEAPELAKYGGELEIDYLEIVVKSKGVLESSSAKASKDKEREATPAPTSKLSSSPTPSTGSASSPQAGSGQVTSTPAFTSSLLIRVLNGGAEKGAAGELAKALTDAGFTNLAVSNADNFNHKNAAIQYRKEDKDEVDKIEELLKKDYKVIEKKEVSTTSAEMTVILGSK